MTQLAQEQASSSIAAKISIILSDSFQLKLKAVMHEFESMQPDGDNPTSGYLSLNQRTELLTKHLGPFGFVFQHHVIEYTQSTTVNTVMSVNLGGQYIPWIERYGSSKNAQRSDGDVAQAGISGWRKVLVALGLSNLVETQQESNADVRTDLISAIDSFMKERSVNTITHLVGIIRHEHSGFDTNMDDVKNAQLNTLDTAHLKKIAYAIQDLRSRPIQAHTVVAKDVVNQSAPGDKDGF